MIQNYPLSETTMNPSRSRLLLAVDSKPKLERMKSLNFTSQPSRQPMMDPTYRHIPIGYRMNTLIYSLKDCLPECPLNEKSYTIFLYIQIPHHSSEAYFVYLRWNCKNSGSNSIS